jgi:hypothetical protein
VSAPGVAQATPQSLSQATYVKIGAMTELLQHAFDTVRRLDPATQDAIARAMLALAGAGEDFDFTLPGDSPSEEEIAALMTLVMPSAIPTKAEAAAWGRLPREEQLRRYRLALDHPDAGTFCLDSVNDILAEVQRCPGEHRGG